MEIFKGDHDCSALAGLCSREGIVNKIREECIFNGSWEGVLKEHIWDYSETILTKKAIHVRCFRHKPQTFEKHLIDIIHGMARGGIPVGTELIEGPYIRIDLKEISSIKVAKDDSFCADVSIQLKAGAFLILHNVTGPHSLATKYWLLIVSNLYMLARKEIENNNLNEFQLLFSAIKDLKASFNCQESVFYKHNKGVCGFVDQYGSTCRISPEALEKIFSVDYGMKYHELSMTSSNNRSLAAPARFKQSDSIAQKKISDYINKYHGSTLKPFVCIYVPALSIGGGSLKLMAWLVDSESYVHQGQFIARIWIEDKHDFTVLLANDSGVIYQSSKTNDIVNIGEVIGTIVLCDDPLSTPPTSGSISDSSLAVSVQSRTTADAIQKGSLQVVSGSTPQFMPSSACEPAGFQPMETAEADLKYALANCKISFQSFYNDLDAVAPHGIDDDVVSIASFDEALYCALVREMHRYSLAEIADNQSDLAKKNAGLGAMVGSLIGLISGNIFAPFLGHSYGKNISDRGKRVEEFLPDPNLLFYQDENSYLSWSKAQVVSPRLRRLILERRVKPDGNVLFRLVPAIVTADSVFPIQLFKVDSSTYFYRPLSAGIDRYQANYDAIKVQKRYFHLRGEGTVAETGIVIPVSGQDIEDYDCRIYRFTCSYLDYFYVDFKIQPGSVF